MREKTTHFGFETVTESEKTEKVRGVFDSVAKKYDLMNDLMSFGIHRAWKQIAVLMAGAKVGSKVLDIASGTADLAKKFSTVVGHTGTVVVSDINNEMLKIGRDRLIDGGFIGNTKFSLADAQALPFSDNTFDIVSIAFGLRNVTDQSQALESMLRVLKPSGKLVILEFSKPTSKLIRELYDHYSFKLIPKLGQVFAKDASSYKYLAESIRMHPSQDNLKLMMRDAGFVDNYFLNLTSGIVAIHSGVKP